MSAYGGEFPGFTVTPNWGERECWLRLNEARALIDAPADESFDATRPRPTTRPRATTLIVYALPNGNTIEQTFGCRLGQGMDWHFDIQHVGAQVRRLREVDATRNYVVALIEADGKSWPKWCDARGAEAGAEARRIVERIVDVLPRGDVHVALLAHSGGGAFLTNYINAADAMPDAVDRIAYLDAYYKFGDDRTTAEHLSRWLRGDRRRVLHCVAYDDRNIEVNGKKVITSADGGTFRGTHRLLDQLTRVGAGERDGEGAGARDGAHAGTGDGAGDGARADTGAPTITDDGPVQYVSAMDGQVRMIIHANPKNLILHTRLVEWNGLLRAMTVGTDLPQTWAPLTERRDYEQWIQPAPATQPATQPATAATTKSPWTESSLALPPRPAGALGGFAFFHKIDTLPPLERESAVLAQIAGGNAPEFLRHLVKIRTSVTAPDGSTHAAEYYVAPDYLAIGGDDDFVRVPMMPMTAQRIADAFGCVLSTRKIADDVYKAAAVKLTPQPLTEAREATRTFLQHNQLIEAQRRETRAELGSLVAGIKKDVVITNRLAEKPARVAIYGWHQPDGRPIQPLTIVHKETYVDYSHGIRLVSRRVIVDGRAMDIIDALKDPVLCGLFSDEGVMTVTRYPTDLPSATTIPATTATAVTKPSEK